MVDARKNKVYKDIYKELKELAMKDENLQEALTVWENLSQTPETMYAYQSRLKYMLDEEAKYVDTLAKGKKEGRAEGIEQGILKVAKELISLNLDLETIKKATGLSTVEIEALRAEM